MSAWTNSYQAPEPIDLTAYADYGPDPYDVHFCFPINESALESERVKLTPFIPRQHAKLHFDQVAQHPELSEYYPVAQQASFGEFLYAFEQRFRKDKDFIAFAIIDKGRPDASHPSWGGSLAGFIAVLRASAVDLSTEIGAIHVYPAFQRTYVTSNAVGLLLRYCLERPDASPFGGLGLRRVQWNAAASNEASAKAALRLGFKFERVERSRRVIYNPGMMGVAPREGDPYPDKPGVDTAVYSFCADNWEDGGRDLVQNAIAIYADYGPEPYDVHFCFPLNLSALESDRVKLVPFIPRLHAQIYFDQLTQYPELNEYFSAAPPSSFGELLYMLENQFRKSADQVAFAIIDKGHPDATHPEWGGSFAGFVALNGATPADLKVEIGSVRVFPAFQRTYVTSNVTGLLLRYCLERRDASPVAGLGLRRVVWGATAKHEASMKAALRMGFKYEGEERWARVAYNIGKKGMAPRQGDPYPDKLRSDSVWYSFCADDWEDGGREMIEKLINRR